jgi:hypothetical protein
MLDEENEKENILSFDQVFRIRFHRIRKFLGLPDPLVRDTDPDPDPPKIKQK